MILNFVTYCVVRLYVFYQIFFIYCLHIYIYTMSYCSIKSNFAIPVYNVQLHVYMIYYFYITIYSIIFCWIVVYCMCWYHTSFILDHYYYSIVFRWYLIISRSPCLFRKEASNSLLHLHCIALYGLVLYCSV